MKLKQFIPFVLTTLIFIIVYLYNTNLYLFEVTKEYEEYGSSLLSLFINSIRIIMLFLGASFFYLLKKYLKSD